MTALTSLDQILALPDNGDFLSGLLKEHQDMMLELVNHKQEHGGKASGTMSIKVNYTLDKYGNLQMRAECDFKLPKTPPSGGVAWMTDDGFLTPENPSQLKMGIKDVDHGRELRTDIA